jgi:hypothetical protein
MPTPKLADELAQQALDWVEQYGSAHAANLAGVGVPKSTIEQRCNTARMRGMRPTIRKDAPRVYTRERLGRMHIVIPDVQAKPGVRLDHLDWVSSYIAEKKPDVVVCIGDFADMESLSVYDRGTIRGEGKRVHRDLKTAREAMDRLTANWGRSKDYTPEMHMTMGNHEYRLNRFVHENPHWEEIIGDHMLHYADWGWKVHPYLKPVEVDGVRYCHYFISGSKGNPVSSAPALLRNSKASSIMGHNQKTDVAFHPYTHQWAIFCGCCYLHDEPYLGPQGNDVRRQILVLHEVEDGKFDPMFVSLRFLEKAYS